MSELKVYRDQEDYIAYDDYMLEAYDKYEADRYIGELKKERDWLAKDRAKAYDDLEKRAQLNIKQEESIRHQKYRRCLAMANWCAAMSVENQHNYKNFPTHKSKFRIEHYSKWYMRWLALADKFKEAKC